MNPHKILLVSALAGLVLSGCVESRANLSPDFGRAVRQNEVAQIADPDARYPKDTPADGARVGLAMKRYSTGTIIPPADIGASDVGTAAAAIGSQSN